MAQIGWFEVNLKTQQYTLSEFVTDLLCLEKKTVGFNDLYHLVHEDYREQKNLKSFTANAYSNRFSLSTQNME